MSTYIKPGSGVYRITSGSDRQILTGRLCDVTAEIQKNAKVEFLMQTEGGEIAWQELSTIDFMDYSGKQREQLLRWLYETDCPMSMAGYEKFSSITDLSPWRIQDALRHPSTPKYSAFSEPAMLWIAFKIQEWRKKKKA